MHGKWSSLGVPHTGWQCTGVDDLGEPNAICEMCETQEIRYVHHMEHPDYSESIAVGCYCAARMESDRQAPRRREQALKNAANRRRHWLTRRWRVSGKGNAYLNTDGMNIVIFQKRPGSWGGRIEDRSNGESISSKGQYASEEAAKLAAFDAMIFLKQERGWGSQ